MVVISDIVSVNFKTHMNYAKCIKVELSGVSIAPLISMSAVVSMGDIRRFAKLAKLTNSSLKADIQGARSEHEYAHVVAPWFAVKCYYRVYYLESILINVYSGSGRPFGNGGHIFVRNEMQKYCRSGSVTSSQGRLETVESCSAAMKHRIPSGSNIASKFYLTQDCARSIRRKLASYATDNWKRNHKKYKAFRTKEARADLQNYINGKSVSLLDYFYYMRVKANYRDADFLDFSSSSAKEALDYIETLNEAVDIYSAALVNAISSAIQRRGFSGINLGGL